MIRKAFDGPRAHHFEVAECDDPHCGPHILSFDTDGNCLSDTIIATQDIPNFCKHLQSIAYAKAVEKDE